MRIGGRRPAAPWLLAFLLLASSLLLVPGPGPAAVPHRGSVLTIATHSGHLPVSRPHGRLAHPPFQVNPNSYYSSEPAPMGIADFGVDPSSGVGYTYNTTEFVGSVELGNLSVYNASNAPYGSQLSVQLNVVLELTSGGNTYQYWIQDVAFIDTSTDYIQFLNNIWNFSGSGAFMSPSDVSGNGSAYYGFYYAGASSGLVGNDITYTYPMLLQLRVIATTAGTGVTSVAFEYNDTGSGWGTYDNVGFIGLKGAKDQGFVVDGTNYNLAGLFNDAELIFGGPGGGSQTTLVASRTSFTLDYWNGHNLQAVTNAYNFGSDTAEGISNVVERGAYWTANGTLFGSMSAGTTLGLHSLYDRSLASLVNVTVPIDNGTLELNGTPVAQFVGYDANITIAPGTYTLGVYATDGQLFASESVVIPAGAYVPILIGANGIYSLTLRETGLPGGTHWQLDLNGVLESMGGSSMALFERNGSYPYTVTPIPGYQLPTYRGNITVDGQNVVATFPWTQFKFDVNFTESGLPSGTIWRVTVGSSAFFGGTTTLTAPLPNGTYAWQVAGVPGYVATPPSGSFAVQAIGASISISWDVTRYALSFVETGLPSGANWAVTVNGAQFLQIGSTLRLSEPNGSYVYSIVPHAGFVASPRSGSVNVTGAPATVSVTFTAVFYRVTFVQTGLPAGDVWSVGVDGLAQSGISTTLNVTLTNGTYVANITAGEWYRITPGAGNFTVRGAALTVDVPFLPEPGWVQGTILPAGATLTINGTEVSLVNGSFNVSEPVGTYTLVATAAGYVTGTYSATVRPGHGVLLTLELALVPPPPKHNATQTLSPAGGLPLSLPILLALIVGIAVVGGIAYALVRRRSRSSEESGAGEPVDAGPASPSETPPGESP